MAQPKQQNPFTQLTAAVDYLRTSLAALQLYHRSLDSGFALKIEIRSLRTSAHRQQLQLWWISVHSRRQAELLWDLCEIEDSAETQGARLARELDRRGLPYKPHGVAVRAPARATPGDAFRYHPMRFRTYHPLAAAAIRSAGLGEHIPAIAEGFRAAKSAVEALLRRRISPLRDQVQELGPRDLTCQTTWLALVYGTFHRRGRIVFDVPNELLIRARKANLKDVAVGSLFLPEPTFYLHFGPQRDLSWRSGWCVDGAYIVRETPDRWRFVVTCAPPAPDTYFRAIRSFEPVCTGIWGPDENNIPVVQAIDRLVAERFAKVRERLEVSLVAKRGARVNEALRERAQQQLASLQRQRGVLIKTLKRLIPILLYISGYEEESEQDSLAQSLGYLVQPDSDPASRARARERVQQLRLRLPSALRRGDLSRTQRRRRAITQASAPIRKT
jgi:hypothetical protein